MPQRKRRQQKECLGCGNSFITFQNYDYCQNCAINNNRYAQSHCPECGDGSGIVKFKNQKPRPCKICHLTKNMTCNDTNKNLKKDPETQFWNEVAEKSKTLIADLIEKTLPISATPQVFNLEKDPDYRVLLRDDLPNSYSESEEYQEKIDQQTWTEEDVEYVAQELTCYYFDIVVKNLVDWLSPHPAFENTQLAQNYEINQY